MMVLRTVTKVYSITCIDSDPHLVLSRIPAYMALFPLLYVFILCRIQQLIS